MNIPSFENSKVIESDGYFTTVWQLVMNQLIDALQKNLSNEGYLVPQLTTTQINDLQTRYGTLTPSEQKQFYGNLVYDSVTDELKVNIAGTFRVVTVV